MAQTATNPKIEELRFRLKSDPKSRLFYPLAEELRKVSAFAEAEQVLRAGLTSHATYLSAWVGLGRVLRDQQKDQEAVEALSRALQLDPGNVVAARLLAQAYLNLGEKVEAIKKFKLVMALLPGDEETEAMVERLEAEINGPAAIPEPPEPMPAPEPESDPFEMTLSGARRIAEAPLPWGDAEPDPPAEPEPLPSFEDDSATPQAAADGGDQPEDSEAGGDGLAPGIMTAPFAVVSSMEPIDAEDFARTLTMADLYAGQGLVDEARDIYEDILARDPNNEMVRAKLDALSQAPGQAAPAWEEESEPAPESEPEAAPLPHSDPEAASGGEPGAQGGKVEKLEGWLAKVRRGEVGRV